MSDSQERADFITHLIEGNNAVLRGDLDAAVQAYEKAKQLNPKYPLIYRKLGEAYYKKNDLAESIDNFKKSLEIDAHQAETLYKLGKVYGEIGMPVQSAVALDMAKEMDREGDLTDRIDETRHRLKRRASGSSSAHKVPLTEVLFDTIGLILFHPLLLLLFAALLLFQILPEYAITLLEPFKLKLVTTVLVSKLIRAVFYTLACGPLLAVAMLYTKYIVQKREDGLAEAFRSAFKHISSISGAVLAIYIASEIVSHVSDFALKTIEEMITEFWHFSVPLTFAKPAVLIAFFAFFAYLLPVIALEKRSMEKSFGKATTFSRRFFPQSLLLVACLYGVHLAAFKFSADMGFQFKLILKALLVIPTAFFPLALTLFYVKSFHAPHQSNRHSQGSKTKSSNSSRHEIETSEEDEDAYEGH